MVQAKKRKTNELKKTSQGNWVGEVVEGGSSLERFCWPAVLLFLWKRFETLLRQKMTNI